MSTLDYDAGQNFATLDNAFLNTIYGDSIDFKLLVDKYKTVRNNLSTDNTLTKSLIDIRKTLEDNYKILYNHQGEILETMKTQMASLTSEEKQTYLTEFSKNFNFDTDTYIRMTHTIITKLNEVKEYQNNCELKINKQNKKLDKLKELFDKLTVLSDDTDTIQSLDSFKKSLDEIVESIKAEKETINKDLLRALLYTEFISQQIADPSIKSLTIYGCPVCLENQIDAFNPICGHTGCTDCLTKAKDCPVCRGSKKEVKPLYFSGNEIAKRDIKPIGIREGFVPGTSSPFISAGELLNLNNNIPMD